MEDPSIGNPAAEGEAEPFSGSILLGVLASLVLGPVVVVGVFVCISVILAMSFGVEISWLAQRTPLDLLYDPGFRGVTFAHFVAMMIGGSAVGLGALGIWWAFTGRTLF